MKLNSVKKQQGEVRFLGIICFFCTIFCGAASDLFSLKLIGLTIICSMIFILCFIKWKQLQIIELILENKK